MEYCTKEDRVKSSVESLKLEICMPRDASRTWAPANLTFARCGTIDGSDEKDTKRSKETARTFSGDHVSSV